MLHRNKYRASEDMLHTSCLRSNNVAACFGKEAIGMRTCLLDLQTMPRKPSRGWAAKPDSCVRLPASSGGGVYRRLWCFFGDTIHQCTYETEGGEMRPLVCTRLQGRFVQYSTWRIHSTPPEATLLQRPKPIASSYLTESS